MPQFPLLICDLRESRLCFIHFWVSVTNSLHIAAHGSVIVSRFVSFCFLMISDYEEFRFNKVHCVTLLKYFQKRRYYRRLERVEGRKVGELLISQPRVVVRQKQKSGVHRTVW